MEHYIISKLSCFEQIFKLDRLFMSQFIFRGHSDADWILKTSFTRTKEDFSIPIVIGYYNREEFEMIDEFQRKYHLFSQFPRPKSNDYFGWLAIMQHYGAPTRLLDFSESLFVALYFAAIDVKAPWDGTQDRKYAIYCINQDKLNSIISQRLSIKKQFINESMDMSHIKLANEFIEGGKKGENIPSMVIPLKPKIYTERLSRQQGLFLMPTNLQYSFENNLLSSFQEQEKLDFIRIEFDELISHSRCYMDTVSKGENEDINVLKIVIDFPASEVLSYLIQMNITAETLFPGLEGLSKSLIQKHIIPL